MEKENLYWIPFRINQEGCATVACGPFSTHEEAMREREIMKANSLMLKEYVGVPFTAANKEEAEQKAHHY